MIKDTQYILNPDYELRRLQNQLVLTEKNSANTNSELILLNSTGELIIENLLSKKNFKELLTIVSKAFNIQSDLILDDMNSFINNLLSKNIIIKIEK
ncbi:PqqD family peptide modification chaperone [Desnuesiella massiliensis]|uniref:PqqD family peptide modification chaperone n=1 Tax=Desnuesiella massiliensis TaxID=1650662 RepID=UPI0006E34658|nr:PqqD family peptide modification chaperone [Desnuesiella massiliensis]